MDFDFPDEMKQLRAETRSFVRGCGSTPSRGGLAGGQVTDHSQV
jgi:hypothetical protein